MDSTLRSMAKAFKALCSDTRLRMLNLLSFRECCVCEVMQVLNISQSRASRNLRLLYDAGFVNMKREGQWIVYYVDQEHMDTFHFELVWKIRQELAHSDTAILDIARLKVTERVLPENNSLQINTSNVRGDGEMVTIEIYGPGCLRCHATRDNLGEALQQLGLKDKDVEQKVKIIHVKDPKEAAKKGIIFTPALVIDGVKVAENRVPDVVEIIEWLKDKLLA